MISPSALWNAATISVNESIAAASVLSVMKSIWFCSDWSPSILADASLSIAFPLAATSLDKSDVNTPSAAIAREASAETAATRAEASEDKSAVNDASPAIRADASAESAASIAVTIDNSFAMCSLCSAAINVAKLSSADVAREYSRFCISSTYVSNDNSASIARDSSASTSAIRADTSVSISSARLDTS